MSKEQADPKFAFPSELDSDLSVEDTAARQRRGIAVKAQARGEGYNPYQSTSNAKPTDTQKRKATDLRKLSEWIKLQRQVDSLKKDEPQE